MRVLVTRPESEWPREQARFAAHGHVAVPCPLLSIRPVSNPQLPLDGVQAILLTSRAAVRALADATSRRDVAVLTVGDATASLAHELGFTHIESAEGDGAALVRHAAQSLSPAAGPLLHAGAREPAGDLAGDLTGAGFEVRRAVLYDVVPAAELPPHARTALSNGALGAVAFFSPRTATTFVSLVSKAGLQSACMTLLALCLSPAVAASAGKLAWRRVCIAAAPNADALLALLESADE